MLSTVMFALAVRSTPCVDVVVAVNGLPDVSLPVTETSNVVSTAKSEPATATL